MNTNFHLAKKFVENKRKQNHESLSGPGSHLNNSQETVEVINRTISNYDIKSILDLGCGDWNWFKNVDITKIQYLGWDACDKMIYDNSELYGCDNIKFETKDITIESYPYSDLIICRDVLFHMTVDLSMTILNKCKSSCQYFICTSFNDVRQNVPHKTGWGFYTINTNIYPFNLQDNLILSREEVRNHHFGVKRYINLYQFK